MENRIIFSDLIKIEKGQGATVDSLLHFAALQFPLRIFAETDFTRIDRCSFTS